MIAYPMKTTYCVGQRSLCTVSKRQTCCTRLSRHQAVVFAVHRCEDRGHVHKPLQSSIQHDLTALMSNSVVKVANLSSSSATPTMYGMPLTPTDQGCRLLMSTVHCIRLPLLVATLLIIRATSFAKSSCGPGVLIASATVFSHSLRADQSDISILIAERPK